MAGGNETSWKLVYALVAVIIALLTGISGHFIGVYANADQIERICHAQEQVSTKVQGHDYQIESIKALVEELTTLQKENVRTQTEFAIKIGDLVSRMEVLEK